MVYKQRVENREGLHLRLALLGSFVALVAAAGFGVARAERLKMLSGALGRLGDTTAQIRVRGGDRGGGAPAGYGRPVGRGDGRRPLRDGDDCPGARRLIL